MAKKRKRASYDIRPKSAHIRKPWKNLSSSGKSYWRSKVDIRGKSERRANPLDRIATATERARYIQPIYRTPYQRRIVEQTGAVYTGPPPPTESQKNKQVRDLRKGKPSYGYDLDDFLSRSSYPDGYSYVTYHLFLLYRYKGERTSGQIVTVRGQMYNTPDDLKQNIDDEIYEVGTDALEDQEGEYIRTIIAVIPQSGDQRVSGSVFPEDYHPKERPGTREFQVEEGKRNLLFPNTPRRKRGQ